MIYKAATVFAEEIPRADAPLNATEERIPIVEKLKGNILDEEIENLRKFKIIM